MDHLFAELPKWAGTAVMVVGIYAVLNFVHFALMTTRYAKGEVPFFLVVRMFSGIWMVFYGSGVAGFLGLTRLARKRGQGEPISADEPYAEKRPAKHLEADGEDDEQTFGVPKMPTIKAGDVCALSATAVWTLMWFGAACVAVARVAEAVDFAALVGLAIAFLMASIGCLFVLHLVRCCLQHRRADDGAISSDAAVQSKDQMQTKDRSSLGPWPRRIFNSILSCIAVIIWCGFALVWNFACTAMMFQSASWGRGWFMLILIPFSLVGWLLLVGLFAIIAWVIESLVRILRRAGSWL